jgi:alanyl-tRNA synthetase
MSKTDKLYYQDAYLRTFTSHVLAVRTLNGHTAVALDQTAFYPTGGGQPNDAGSLAGLRVSDVLAEDDLVWHVLEAGQAGAPDASAPDAPAPGAAALDPAALTGAVEVTGVLDWERRFDHMQQHTGQHVLSEAFIRSCNAHTVAFHLGSGAVTIDLDRADLTHVDLAHVEAAANAVIERALPVKATFVTDAELAALPLRKQPTVTGAVRIVEVAGYDWSACGGTHVANTAQIGLIKIIGSERRGAELRIAFLCGGRARADYARLQGLAEGLMARFTTGQDEVLGAVDRLVEGAKATRKDLATLEGEWAESTAAAWWAEAPAIGAWRVVSRVVDYPVERARRVAQVLKARPGTLIFLGVRAERPQLLFGRADDVTLNAGELLKAAAAAGGGRGGGRPEWAQGGVPSAEGLEVALAAVLARVKQGGSPGG